jgi:hypothetical protein
MKLLPGIMIFSLAFIATGVQNFIGLKEHNIRAIMSEEKPEMIINDKVRNDTYKYLKYHSKDENETWVIFLDDKGKCDGVRITCDNSLLNDKIKELNENYKSKDKGQWSCRSKGDEITIGLKEDPWFFTITYKKTEH